MSKVLSEGFDHWDILQIWNYGLFTFVWLDLCLDYLNIQQGVLFNKWSIAVNSPALRGRLPHFQDVSRIFQIFPHLPHFQDFLNYLAHFHKFSNFLKKNSSFGKTERQNFLISENRDEKFADFPKKNSDKIGFHERFSRFPDFPI